MDTSTIKNCDNAEPNRAMENSKKRRKVEDVHTQGIEELEEDRTKLQDGVWTVRKVAVEEIAAEEKLIEENVSHQEDCGCCSEVLQLQNQFKSMCLHEAVDKRLFSSVLQNLSKDENINHVNILGATPLHYAAESGATAIALLLIDNGADVNKPDGDAFTPLILAADENHVEIVKALIKAGADVNYTDDYHLSALHYATSRGHKKTVKALLKAGARTDIGDYEGYLPYHYALFSNYHKLAELILDYAPLNDGPSNDEPEPQNSGL